MESILDGIDKDLRKQLAGHSMRRMKLKGLDHLLEGHENDVLKTYHFWLLEGLMANSPSEAGPARPPISRSELQSWCDRLQRNYGIDSKRIFDTFCACIPDSFNSNATNRVHLEQIKEDIQLLLFRSIRKKKRKRQSPADEDDKVPFSVRSSDRHTVRITDNEEYRKTTMHFNNTVSNGLKSPELIDTSSDSDPEVETLDCNQGQRRHHLHPSGGPEPSEGAAPDGRPSDRTEQKSSDLGQQHGPHYVRESRSPPHMGVSSHRADTHRERRINQPIHVAPTQDDSCRNLGRIYYSDDFILRVNKEMKGTQTKFTSRRQEADAQEGDIENHQRIKLVTYEKTEPGPLVSKPGTSRLQRTKRNQDQTKRSEKPHDDYLCYRCEVPGHFLQDCPTNLDPSFDRAPVGGYKCMICGQLRAHLTSLCPNNTDPKSLTQLRRRFGTVTSRQLQEKVDNHLGYEKKDQKEDREGMLDSLNDGIMNEDRRRAILELGDDHDDQLLNQDSFEARYMRAKRAYSLLQSPQDQNIDQYTSPPPKRVRHDDRNQETSREHSRTRDHEICVKNSDFLIDPSEMLASLDRPRADLGRLSYWDSGEQLSPAAKKSCPLRYRGPVLSSSPLLTKKQPLTQGIWLEDNRLEELKCLYPYADPDWVNDMAGFDIDEFLGTMDDLILSTASDTLPVASFTKVDEQRCNSVVA